MRFHALILIWLFSILWPALMLAEKQDAGIRFIHRERSLQPGEVVLIQAESSRPLRRMAIAAFGREFPTFIEDHGLKGTGLLGIDLDTMPGVYPIELKGMDFSGGTIISEDTLTVAGKNFPTRRLTVEGKYVSPPAELLSRIEEERKKVNAIFDSISPERFWRGSFSLPVPGIVLSAFGKRSVYNGQPRSPHTGVDFRGPTGTPVRTPNAGRVMLAANLYYSGNTVIIDHGLGLYSYFGHMSSLSVKEGDPVRIRDVIGKIGATGVVTGPHLHWTVRLARTRVDPLSLVAVLGNSRDILK
jgi:murein DD-endopeptidase MepM/ murein hydrolase activator NlpD